MADCGGRCSRASALRATYFLAPNPPLPSKYIQGYPHLPLRHQIVERATSRLRALCIGMRSACVPQKVGTNFGPYMALGLAGEGLRGAKGSNGERS